MARFARIDLSRVQFTPELLRCIPAATARMYQVLPIFDSSACLGIVVAEPSQLGVIDELHFVLGRELQVHQADAEQIKTRVDRFYGDHER